MPIRRSFDVGGVHLSALVGAEARRERTPVVLLPGTGSSAEDWSVVAHEVERGRSVVAVDLRGHGASDWPGEYSIDLMARDVEALLPQLAPQVDLVGHSLGGLVACRVASRAPGSVRRLVLEDVGIPRPRIPRPLERPPGDLAFDWRMVEQVRPEIDDPDPTWRQVVAGLRMPVLVIAGGPSSPVPQEGVADLVAAGSAARSVTIDAGHLVHAMQPGRFVQELLAFLDDDVLGP